MQPKPAKSGLGLHINALFQGGSSKDVFPTVLYVLVATELYWAGFKFSVCTGFLVKGQSLKTAAEDLLSLAVLWGHSQEKLVGQGFRATAYRMGRHTE